MDEEEEEDILSPALSLEQTYYNQGHALGQEDGTKAGQQEGRRFGLEKGFDKFFSIARLHGRAIVWNSRYSQSNSQPLVFSSSLAATATARVPPPPPPPPPPTQDTHSRIFLPQLFSSGFVDDLEREGVNSELEPPQLQPQSSTGVLQAAGGIKGDGGADGDVLAGASRIGKHVAVLYALTEIECLSMENTEEAVSEFDDRYRRAVAKAGIIGRLVGERVVDGGWGKDGTEEGRGYGSGGAAEGEGEVEDIVLMASSSATATNSRLMPEIGRDGEELEIEIR